LQLQVNLQFQTRFVKQVSRLPAVQHVIVCPQNPAAMSIIAVVCHNRPASGSREPKAVYRLTRAEPAGPRAAGGAGRGGPLHRSPCSETSYDPGTRGLPARQYGRLIVQRGASVRWLLSDNAAQRRPVELQSLVTWTRSNHLPGVSPADRSPRNNPLTRREAQTVQGQAAGAAGGFARRSEATLPIS
jgi:hypothetical protein